MHVVITGANGFIGKALSKAVLEEKHPFFDNKPVSRLSLMDLDFDQSPQAGECQIRGSFADQHVLDKTLATPADVVFHLASVPSGRCEEKPDLGMEVNVQGTLRLLKKLRDQDKQSRFIFASSIAVFGKPQTPEVNDDTLPTPTLSYGAHKVIGEVLVNDYVRRNWLRGCSLRLPGIVTRPPEPNGAVSIFFSDLIRELCAGRPVTCPVSPHAKSWLISVDCCVDNLLHALTLPDGDRNTWTLPARYIAIEELVEAIVAFTGNPQVRELIRYQPDPWVEKNFGSYPPIHCPKAEAAGFKADADLAALVRRSLPA